MFDAKSYMLVQVQASHLNFASSGQLREYVAGLIQAGNINIILDLAALNDLYSMGIGVLISIHKKIKEQGGNLKLIGLNPGVVKTLAAVELNKIFECFTLVSE